jgi:IS5 family transposase
MFQIDLEQLIDMHHPLVLLGQCIGWTALEATLGASYHPSQGAPGISTRLMVALHNLKYQHDLSDEDVVAVWVENPYWQQFSGERYFPRPVSLGARAVGWIETEVEEWIARQIEVSREISGQRTGVNSLSSRWGPE